MSGPLSGSARTAENSRTIGTAPTHRRVITASPARTLAIGIRSALNRGLGNGTTLAEPMSDWRNPTCSERGNFGASDEWLSSLSHEEAHMGQFIRVASTADLASGETRCVEASGKKIAL